MCRTKLPLKKGAHTRGMREQGRGPRRSGSPSCSLRAAPQAGDVKTSLFFFRFFGRAPAGAVRLESRDGVCYTENLSMERSGLPEGWAYVGTAVQDPTGRAAGTRLPLRHQELPERQGTAPRRGGRGVRMGGVVRDRGGGHPADLCVRGAHRDGVRPLDAAHPARRRPPAAGAGGPTTTPNTATWSSSTAARRGSRRSSSG